MTQAGPENRRRVVITEAGGGIGRAAAVRLASKGAAIALLDVRPGELQATAEEVRGFGGEVLQFVADVRELMNSHVLSDPRPLAEAEQLIPLRRVGQPSEVPGVIDWLPSDDASYATGGYFPVDGGQMCL